MNQKNNSYRVVKIPKSLADYIEKNFVKKNGLGYRTVSEFVIEAARRRAEMLSKQVYPRREDSKEVIEE